MAAASFRKWPDPLLDFGLEVEAARQIALGKAFSRDVALLHGPLPFEVNALLFRLFGPSLAITFAANLLVLAGTTALAWRLLARAADRFAATAAGLFFLLVLAFGQYTPGGNYNWVSPYTAGSTWGLFLGLLMVDMLVQYERTREIRLVAAAGLALGLSFLTKSEPFVASLLTAVAGMALLFFRKEGGTRKGGAGTVTALVSFAAAVVLPPLAFFLFYAIPRGFPSTRCLSPSEALRAVLGPWPHLLGSSASQMPFFRDVMGTRDPSASLASLAQWTAVDLAVFLPAFLATRWFPRQGTRGRVGLVLTLSAAVIFLGSTFRSDGWFDVARPLPLFLAAHLAALVLSKKRLPVAWSSAFLLSVLGLGLLAKTSLSVRLTHYGFTLAMPAALLAVAALTGWIPERLAARGGEGRVFRLYACGVLAVLAGVYLANSLYRLSGRTCEVGSGPNRFFADGRGCFVQEALVEIGRRVAPEETLAVLPEGAMINFLSRRSNPTPYLNFMPLEIAVFGEGRMLAAYRARPPDWILLVHRDASEFGPRFFGRDYAPGVADWIATTYENAALFGDPPFEGPGFGMRLLKRRTPR